MVHDLASQFTDLVQNKLTSEHARMDLSHDLIQHHPTILFQTSIAIDEAGAKNIPCHGVDT
jgi:hypothetical protein